MTETTGRPRWRTKSREAPEARRPLLRSREASARAASAPSCGALARRHRHLRARLVGQCGGLFQISDRDFARHAGRLDRPVGRLALRRAAEARGAVVVSVSQSGKSPDIVSLQAAAQAAGAFAIAVVNDAGSPLAKGADAVLPLHSGVERSVAATKTFLSSAAILAALVAEWRGDASLTEAIRELPQVLDKALACRLVRGSAGFARSKFGLCGGPRTGSAHRRRGSPEAEGNGGAACGSLQRRRGHAWPASTGRDRDFQSSPCAPATRRSRRWAKQYRRLGNAGAKVFVAEAGEARPGRLPVTCSGSPLLDPLVMLLVLLCACRAAGAGSRPRSRPAEPPEKNYGDHVMTLQALKGARIFTASASSTVTRF